MHRTAKGLRKFETDEIVLAHGHPVIFRGYYQDGHARVWRSFKRIYSPRYKEWFDTDPDYMTVNGCCLYHVPKGWKCTLIEEKTNDDGTLLLTPSVVASP